MKGFLLFLLQLFSILAGECNTITVTMPWSRFGSGGALPLCTKLTIVLCALHKGTIELLQLTCLLIKTFNCSTFIDLLLDPCVRSKREFSMCVHIWVTSIVLWMVFRVSVIGRLTMRKRLVLRLPAYQTGFENLAARIANPV